MIALISSPLIMGTITKAKKNALKDTVYGVLKAAENYQAEDLMNQEGEIEPLVIHDLKTDSKLQYKGTKPKCGSLAVLKNQKTMIHVSDGQNIITKTFDDKDVKVEKGTCDDLENIIASIKPIQNGLLVDYEGTVPPVLENGKLIWKDQSGNGHDGEMVSFPSTGYYQNKGIVFSDKTYIRTDEINVPEVTLDMYYELNAYPPDSVHLFGNEQIGGYALYVGFREPTTGIKTNTFMIHNGVDWQFFPIQQKEREAKLHQKYYLGGTFDGTTASLKINENSFSYIPGGFRPTTLNTVLTLGTDPIGKVPETTRFLNGTVYSARMYNRALTSDELEYNYALDKYKYGK